MSPEAAAHRMQLGQFFTPAWAAEAIVERFYPTLTRHDLVLEPSCGEGAFLAAIPAHVPALGVELDPRLATLAAQRTGRTVLQGDFLRASLPAGITAVVGNPPFKSSLVERFLDRTWTLLPEDGQAGFILPAYVMQTSSTVMRFAERWSVSQELLPRNLFPRLKLPIVFSVFTKVTRRPRTLVGFFLYAEAEDVRALNREARALTQAGTGRSSVWVAVVNQAMSALGGEATLDELYAKLEPKRPTANRWWKEQVRQVLQRSPQFEPVTRGRWRQRQATAPLPLAA